MFRNILVKGLDEKQFFKLHLAIIYGHCLSAMRVISFNKNSGIGGWQVFGDEAENLSNFLLSKK